MPLLQTSFLTTFSIPEERESCPLSFTRNIRLLYSIWDVSQVKDKSHEGMTSFLHTWSSASSGYWTQVMLYPWWGQSTHQLFKFTRPKCAHLKNSEITDCVCQYSFECLTFFTLSILCFNTCCVAFYVKVNMEPVSVLMKAEKLNSLEEN